MASRTYQLTWVMIAASLIGLALASVSLLHNSGIVSGSFCALDETINCDVVNRGPFSTIGPVPVALIGVLGYLFLSVGSVMLLRQPKDKALVRLLLLASGAGLLFSFYLTYLEAFVLDAWCLLCLGSQAVIFVVFCTTIWYHQLLKKAF